MNKILLAFIFLGAGAGAFQSARQHVTRLTQKAQAASESWQICTQQLAVAQSEHAALAERIGELKQTLAQARPGAGNTLWPALQTNRADRLPAALRRRALSELGFNWQSSPDYVVVTKQAVRDVQMAAVRNGKFTDVAAAVLALTPEERGQVETAIEQVRTDFQGWVLAHIERTEPTTEVLAHYTLPKDPAMSQSISNRFNTTVLGALGRERTELILPTAQGWMKSIGLYDCDAKPMMMAVKRSPTGNERRLMVEVSSPDQKGGPRLMDLVNQIGEFVPFPRAFRTLFPNGWADVASREGFELPAESKNK